MSESGRDLSAEAAAAGESERGHAAGRRDGGPQGSAEGAQRPDEGPRGDHDRPEGLVHHQEPRAGEM